MLKGDYEPGRSYSLRQEYDGKVNTPHEQIYANVRFNIRRPLPQVHPWPANDYRAMLLCGGPSLGDHLPEIRKKRRAGWKIITVNAVHEWCVDRGLTPSLHVQLDARDFNARFVSRPQKECRYLLASQVSPKVFEALEGHDVHIWHPAGGSRPETQILDRYYLGRWYKVSGGTCVGPRALWLAYVVGIRTTLVFGMDSCLTGERHHAYPQDENDTRLCYRVRVGRRIFRCQGWMLKQADEFCEMAAFFPKDYAISIRGRGMIAHIVECTAKMGHPPKMTILDTKEV